MSYIESETSQMSHIQEKNFIVIRNAPAPKPHLQNRARQLRKNDTEPEYKLWYVLRGKRLGVKFRRQQVIGPYIVDFYCSELKLVIEADGGQHTIEKDAKRDLFLRSEGMTVLRFWNNDIMGNIDGVADRVAQVVREIKISAQLDNMDQI